jgi:hypothetical protein
MYRKNFLILQLILLIGVSTGVSCGSADVGVDEAAIVEEINLKFSEINYCDTRAECSLAPIGCYGFAYNRQEEEVANSLQEIYSERLGECDLIFGPTFLECVDGTCI